MKTFSSALTIAWRQSSISSDAWPGVVLKGEGWRVILNRTASRFVLQRRDSAGRDRRWQPAYVAGGLRDWPAVLGDGLPGLERLAASPDPLVEVLPRLAAEQGVAVAQVQRRREWASPDYPFVLRQDANIRVVRDPTGNLYAVQWVPPSDYQAGVGLHWVTQAVAPERASLLERFGAKVFSLDDVDVQATEQRLAALFDGLPEVAALGLWSVVKVIPSP